ncbi:predicted protein [Arabidopsis lyrata subsp. lyrata]|uniref:Predicted protein n=1 Tax=Arabidopsis lyrata subsp. lyrata TaxID=81972 RepID=D7LR47_ARALL|nr:predicted protein [Arabidopsis lyrata subsp. lyrata]
MNSDHYASWIVHLGGAMLITNVEDRVGVEFTSIHLSIETTRFLRGGFTTVGDVCDWTLPQLVGEPDDISKDKARLAAL